MDTILHQSLAPPRSLSRSFRAKAHIAEKETNAGRAAAAEAKQKKEDLVSKQRDKFKEAFIAKRLQQQLKQQQ